MGTNNMKYYYLGFSDNYKEVGKQPQAPDIKLLEYNTGDYGFDGPISVPLVPPQPIIQKGAKPTTILNVVSVNTLIYIVCERYFIEFLSRFNTEEFNSWPMQVHFKNEILNDYYLFHLSFPSDNKYLNFEQSKFQVGKIGDWNDISKRQNIIIENYENYINLREVLNKEDEGLEIKYNKIILNLNNVSEDIFRLEVPAVRGYYVSEKLKNSIEEQHFTGIAFQEIEEMDKRIEAIY